MYIYMYIYSHISISILYLLDISITFLGTLLNLDTINNKLLFPSWPWV